MMIGRQRGFINFPGEMDMMFSGNVTDISASL